MTAPHVLSALRRRYAVALGREAYADLAALGAVILMFDSLHDLEAIAPIRERGAYQRWRPTVLAVLRTANGPMTATQIARQVVARLGVAPDPNTLNSIAASLHHSLAGLTAKGLVIAEGRPRRFSLALVRE